MFGQNTLVVANARGLGNTGSQKGFGDRGEQKKTNETTKKTNETTKPKKVSGKPDETKKTNDAKKPKKVFGKPNKTNPPIDAKKPKKVSGKPKKTTDEVEEESGTPGVMPTKGNSTVAKEGFVIEGDFDEMEARRRFGVFIPNGVVIRTDPDNPYTILDIDRSFYFRQYFDEIMAELDVIESIARSTGRYRTSKMKTSLDNLRTVVRNTRENLELVQGKTDRKTIESEEKRKKSIENGIENLKNELTDWSKVGRDEIEEKIQNSREKVISRYQKSSKELMSEAASKNVTYRDISRAKSERMKERDALIEIKKREDEEKRKKEEEERIIREEKGRKKEEEKAKRKKESKNSKKTNSNISRISNGDRTAKYGYGNSGTYRNSTYGNSTYGNGSVHRNSTYGSGSTRLNGNYGLNDSRSRLDSSGLRSSSTRATNDKSEKGSDTTISTSDNSEIKNEETKEKKARTTSNIFGNIGHERGIVKFDEERFRTNESEKKVIKKNVEEYVKAYVGKVKAVLDMLDRVAEGVELLGDLDLLDGEAREAKLEHISKKKKEIQERILEIRDSIAIIIRDKKYLKVSPGKEKRYFQRTQEKRIEEEINKIRKLLVGLGMTPENFESMIKGAIKEAENAGMRWSDWPSVMVSTERSRMRNLIAADFTEPAAVMPEIDQMDTMLMEPTAAQPTEEGVAPMEVPAEDSEFDEYQRQHERVRMIMAATARNPIVHHDITNPEFAAFGTRNTDAHLGITPRVPLPHQTDTMPVEATAAQPTEEGVAPMEVPTEDFEFDEYERQYEIARLITATTARNPVVRHSIADVLATFGTMPMDVTAAQPTEEGVAPMEVPAEDFEFDEFDEYLGQEFAAFGTRNADTPLGITTRVPLPHSTEDNSQVPDVAISGVAVVDEQNENTNENINTQAENAEVNINPLLALSNNLGANNPQQESTLRMSPRPELSGSVPGELDGETQDTTLVTQSGESATDAESVARQSETVVAENNPQGSEVAVVNEQDENNVEVSGFNVRKRRKMPSSSSDGETSDEEISDKEMNEEETSEEETSDEEVSDEEGKSMMSLRPKLNDSLLSNSENAPLVAENDAQIEESTIDAESFARQTETVVAENNSQESEVAVADEQDADVNKNSFFVPSYIEESSASNAAIPNVEVVDENNDNNDGGWNDSSAFDYEYVKQRSVSPVLETAEVQNNHQDHELTAVNKKGRDDDEDINVEQENTPRMSPRPELSDSLPEESNDETQDTPLVAENDVQNRSTHFVTPSRVPVSYSSDDLEEITPRETIQGLNSSDFSPRFRSSFVDEEKTSDESSDEEYIPMMSIRHKLSDSLPEESNDETQDTPLVAENDVQNRNTHFITPPGVPVSYSSDDLEGITPRETIQGLNSSDFSPRFRSSFVGEEETNDEETSDEGIIHHNFFANTRRNIRRNQEGTTAMPAVEEEQSTERSEITPPMTRVARISRVRATPPIARTIANTQSEGFTADAESVARQSETVVSENNSQESEVSIVNEQDEYDDEISDFDVEENVRKEALTLASGEETEDEEFIQKQVLALETSSEGFRSIRRLASASEEEADDEEADDEENTSMMSPRPELIDSIAEESNNETQDTPLVAENNVQTEESIADAESVVRQPEIIIAGNNSQEFEVSIVDEQDEYDDEISDFDVEENVRKEALTLASGEETEDEEFVQKQLLASETGSEGFRSIRRLTSASEEEADDEEADDEENTSMMSPRPELIDSIAEESNNETQDTPLVVENDAQGEESTVDAESVVRQSETVVAENNSQESEVSIVNEQDENNNENINTQAENTSMMSPRPELIDSAAEESNNETQDTILVAENNAQTEESIADAESVVRQPEIIIAGNNSQESEVSIVDEQDENNNENINTQTENAEANINPLLALSNNLEANNQQQENTSMMSPRPELIDSAAEESNNETQGVPLVTENNVQTEESIADAESVVRQPEIIIAGNNSQEFEVSIVDEQNENNNENENNNNENENNNNENENNNNENENNNNENENNNNENENNNENINTQTENTEANINPLLALYNNVEANNPQQENTSMMSPRPELIDSAAEESNNETQDTSLFVENDLQSEESATDAESVAVQPVTAQQGTTTTQNMDTNSQIVNATIPSNPPSNEQQGIHIEFHNPAADMLKVIDISKLSVEELDELFKKISEGEIEIDLKKSILPNGFIISKSSTANSKKHDSNMEDMHFETENHNASQSLESSESFFENNNGQRVTDVINTKNNQDLDTSSVSLESGNNAEFVIEQPEVTAANEQVGDRVSVFDPRYVERRLALVEESHNQNVLFGEETNAAENLSGMLQGRDLQHDPTDNEFNIINDEVKQAETRLVNTNTDISLTVATDNIEARNRINTTDAQLETTTERNVQRLENNDVNGRTQNSALNSFETIGIDLGTAHTCIAPYNSERQRVTNENNTRNYEDSQLTRTPILAAFGGVGSHSGIGIPNDFLSHIGFRHAINDIPDIPDYFGLHGGRIGVPDSFDGHDGFGDIDGLNDGFDVPNNIAADGLPREPSEDDALRVLRNRFNVASSSDSNHKKTSDSGEVSKESEEVSRELADSIARSRDDPRNLGDPRNLINIAMSDNDYSDLEWDLSDILQNTPEGIDLEDENIENKGSENVFEMDEEYKYRNNEPLIENTEAEKVNNNEEEGDEHVNNTRVENNTHVEDIVNHDIMPVVVSHENIVHEPVVENIEAEKVKNSGEEGGENGEHIDNTHVEGNVHIENNTHVEDIVNHDIMPVVFINENVVHEPVMIGIADGGGNNEHGGDGPKKPGKGPKKPDNEPKKPDNEPKKPDNEPKKPDNEPKKPDNEPKKPDNEPKKPDNEPKKPDNEPKKPDNEPKKPEGNDADPNNNNNADIGDYRDVALAALAVGGAVAVTINAINKNGLLNKNETATEKSRLKYDKDNIKCIKDEEDYYTYFYSEKYSDKETDIYDKIDDDNESTNETDQSLKLKLRKSVINTDGEEKNDTDLVKSEADFEKQGNTTIIEENKPANDVENILPNNDGEREDKPVSDGIDPVKPEADFEEQGNTTVVEEDNPVIKNDKGTGERGNNPVIKNDKGTGEGEDRPANDGENTVPNDDGEGGNNPIIENDKPSDKDPILMSVPTNQPLASDFNKKSVQRSIIYKVNKERHKKLIEDLNNKDIGLSIYYDTIKDRTFDNFKVKEVGVNYNYNNLFGFNLSRNDVEKFTFYSAKAMFNYNIKFVNNKKNNDQHRIFENNNVVYSSDMFKTLSDSLVEKITINTALSYGYNYTNKSGFDKNNHDLFMKVGINYNQELPNDFMLTAAINNNLYLNKFQDSFELSPVLRFTFNRGIIVPSIYISYNFVNGFNKSSVYRDYYRNIDDNNFEYGLSLTSFVYKNFGLSLDLSKNNRHYTNFSFGLGLNF